MPAQWTTQGQHRERPAWAVRTHRRRGHSGGRLSSASAARPHRQPQERMAVQGHGMSTGTRARATVGRRDCSPDTLRALVERDKLSSADS